MNNLTLIIKKMNNATFIVNNITLIFIIKTISFIFLFLMFYSSNCVHFPHRPSGTTDYTYMFIFYITVILFIFTVLVPSFIVDNWYIIYFYCMIFRLILGLPKIRKFVCMFDYWFRLLALQYLQTLHNNSNTF